MQTAARGLLWCAALCLAVAIAVRWVAGPYQFMGMPVHAPLNGAGAFGAIITILLAWRATATTKPEARWDWPLVASAAVALIALVPVFSLGFLSDDFIIVHQSRDLWHAFTHGGGDGFFRPLGYVSWSIDAAYSGDSPALWHVCGWLLHAANSGLVALLARRLGAGSLTAGLAGVLFALHGTHLEAAAWIAGRFDLLAALFTLGALLWFGRNTALAIACTIAALLSKEAAYALPALIACIAWRERRGWRPVLPFLGVTLVMFFYRWSMVGGIGGYREADGGSSFFSLRTAAVAKILFARLWTSLYFPINWSSEPGTLLTLVVVAYLAALLWLAWRAQASTGFRTALVMLLASILPALHLLGGAADLSGGRLLYLPSIFFCAMLALALEGLTVKATLRVATILIVFHAAALYHDFPFWHAASERVKAICEKGEEPIGMIDGIPALANGYENCKAK